MAETHFSDEVAEAMSAEHGSLTIDEMVARMRDAGYEDWEIADEVDETVWAKSRSESRQAITAEQIAARADDAARSRIPGETIAGLSASALVAERPEPTMGRAPRKKAEAQAARPLKATQEELDAVLAAHARWAISPTSPSPDRADLSGADLSNMDLQGADLKLADMRGARLQGASLRHADLSHANLTQAQMLGCDLSGANLTMARLEDAHSAKLAVMEAHASAEGVTGAPARLLVPPLLAYLASEVEESSEGMAFVEDSCDLYERGFNRLDMDDMLGYLESCGDDKLRSCIATEVTDPAADCLITAFSNLPDALATHEVPHEAPSQCQERGRQAGKAAPEGSPDPTHTVANVAKQARERARSQSSGQQRRQRPAHSQRPKGR